MYCWPALQKVLGLAQYVHQTHGQIQEIAAGTAEQSKDGAAATDNGQININA